MLEEIITGAVPSASHETLRRTVFFGVFAAAEPSVNVCVAHWTICNDPSVCIAATAYSCGCEFRPRQFRFLSAKPLTATR